MAQPIQIGSFCSDYVIQDPPLVDYPGASDGAYYRRIDPTTNKMYYLAINTAGTVIEVENPIEGTTSLTINHFKLKLLWNRTLVPVLDSGVLTPINELRYLSSVEKLGAFQPIMVKVSPAVNNPTEITLRAATGITVPNSSAITLNQFSAVTGNSTILKYTQTPDPPTSVTRGNLVYLVDNDDDNNNVITSSTTKRYLIVVPPSSSSSPPNVGILDLFKPEVTEAMINQTLFRINKKVSLENSNDITYSIDVFRTNITGSRPNTSSTLNYREINLDARTGITMGTIVDPNDGFFTGTSILYNSRSYIVARDILDKSISDLYGELSLGLFTLWDSVNNRETNPKLYLGYDCSTPGNTCATASRLVVREYFNYLQPTRSCQFRMYDLGNNEYMILVTDPFANPPTRLVMKPKSDGTIEFRQLTAITKEERGWHLEPVDSAKQTVRLRWNYPSSPLPDAQASGAGIYISVDSSNVVRASLQISASTFVCIRCSYIDEETGTCAPNKPMYIDHDLDYISSPRLVSPTPLGLARNAPTSIENFKIQRNSDQKQMVVSDDGFVSFGDVGDMFFTTRTGILTLQEQQAGTVFIATQAQAPSGEYLYAKYTVGSPPNLRFVAATNPSVADGFGWIISGNNTIRMSSSPVPITQFTGITILKDVSVTIDPASYDKENDRYTVTFSALNPNDRITNVNGLANYDTNTRTAIVQASLPRSPVTSPPSFSPSVNTLNVTAVVNGKNVPVSIQIPEAPKPVVTRIPASADLTPSRTGVTVRNLEITNMDRNATVTFSLRATGSATSISPTGGSTTYGDFSSGFLIQGLTASTTYTAPSFTVVHSRNKNPISFTVPGTFTTSSFVINATYMNGGAAGREFYLKVGTQYIKLNITGGNVDFTEADGVRGNRFWQTTDKTQASKFIVDTARTYLPDNTFKTIKLSSYHNGSSMVSYTGGAAYLRHYIGWVYKNNYGGNNNFDFHWRFEDVAGGMKIRNPINANDSGLRFVSDSGVMKLQNNNGFNSADTFTVEF